MSISALFNCAWDWVGDNVAAIIAVCALGFTAYQTYTTRRHNRLMVRPKLDLIGNRVLGSDRGKISLSIMNNGLGPAIIEAFDVTVDGKAIDLRVPSQVEAAIASLFGPKRNFTIGTFAVGAAIRKDESRLVLEVEFPARDQIEYDAIESQLQRITVVISYKSLYDNVYSFTMGQK